MLGMKQIEPVCYNGTVVCVCVCGDENTEPNYPFNESDTFILAIIDTIFITLKHCLHTERAFGWGFGVGVCVRGHTLEYTHLE